MEEDNNGAEALSEFTEAVVEHFLWNLHTCIPARIIEITDYQKQKATVQPLIKERNRDAKGNAAGLQDMAFIQGVPIVFPSANTGTITFPIKKGDIVLLIFSERSVDNFVFSDGVSPVDPDDFRKHNYTDAIAIAGLSTFSKALGIHPENTVLRMNANTGKEVKISLTPSGDLLVDSPTQVIVNATNKVEVNTKVANVNASESVTIDSPQTTCTGELRVDGGISVGNDVITDAGSSANTHKHIGNLSKPTSTFI